MSLKTAVLVFLPGLLAGCSNLSGLGGSPTFQCKAPEGIPCMSVSGVDANERAGTLPLLRPTAVHPAGQAPTDGGTGRADATVGVAAAASAAASGPSRPPRVTLLPMGAIRSEPTVIRMWIAPWEDADGDLHDQSLIYLQADTGRWLIEHNRERIRRAFAPATAGKAAPPPGDAGPGSAASTSRNATATTSTAPRPASPAPLPAGGSTDSRPPAAGSAR